MKKTDIIVDKHRQPSCAIPDGFASCWPHIIRCVTSTCTPPAPCLRNAEKVLSPARCKTTGVGEIASAALETPFLRRRSSALHRPESRRTRKSLQRACSRNLRAKAMLASFYLAQQSTRISSVGDTLEH